MGLPVQLFGGVGVYMVSSEFRVPSIGWGIVGVTLQEKSKRSFRMQSGAGMPGFGTGVLFIVNKQIE